MKIRITEVSKKCNDNKGIGYACLYPHNNGEAEKYTIETDPENIANLLGNCLNGVRRAVITDMAGSMILDAYGGFINKCQNKTLCDEIMEYLAPIQTEEKAAGAVRVISFTEG